MTDKAITEAKAYIDRSIRHQQQLGYKKPAAPTVRAAVKDAAKAVDTLHRLRPLAA